MPTCQIPLFFRTLTITMVMTKRTCSFLLTELRALGNADNVFHLSGDEEKVRLFLYDAFYFRSPRNHIFLCILLDVSSPCVACTEHFFPSGLSVKIGPFPPHVVGVARNTHLVRLPPGLPGPTGPRGGDRHLGHLQHITRQDNQRSQSGCR